MNRLKERECVRNACRAPASARLSAARPSPGPTGRAPRGPLPPCAPAVRARARAWVGEGFVCVCCLRLRVRACACVRVRVCASVRGCRRDSDNRTPVPAGPRMPELHPEKRDAKPLKER